jgi:hypothetical protein
VGLLTVSIPSDQYNVEAGHEVELDCSVSGSPEVTSWLTLSCSYCICCCTNITSFIWLSSSCYSERWVWYRSSSVVAITSSCINILSQFYTTPQWYFLPEDKGNLRWTRDTTVKFYLMTSLYIVLIRWSFLVQRPSS